MLFANELRMICECGHGRGRHAGPMDESWWPEYDKGSHLCGGTQTSIIVSDCDCKDFVEMVDVPVMIAELQRMEESLR